MKTRFILPVLLVIAALAVAPAAQAKPREGGSTGVGVGSGTFANGLSIKHVMGGSAIQANVGSWGTYRKFGGGLALSADYLLEMPTLASVSILDVAWNVGLGAGAGLVSDSLAVAAAGVAGLEFNFKPLPIDLVLEYRPGLLIVPDVSIDLVNFTGHLRWYF